MGAIEKRDKFGNDIVCGDDRDPIGDRLTKLLGSDQVMVFGGDEETSPARGIDEEIIRHCEVLGRGLRQCIRRGFQRGQWCRGLGCR